MNLKHAITLQKTKRHNSMRQLLYVACMAILISPATSSGAPQKPDVKQLEQLFNSLDYHWPNKQNHVPRLLLKQLPRDFARVRDTRKRKKLFVQIMTPIALMEKQRLEEHRSLALLLSSQTSLNSSRWLPWLKQISSHYRITAKPGDLHYTKKLATHLDSLPIKLIIAQAAIESGWGSSRFALEGNSLFGQWSFNGQGMVPESRDANAKHRVASFESLQDSVKAYLQNINTNRAYQKLRNMRLQMRSNNQPLDPFLLAEGLDKYSQRGDAYVQELKSIMRSAEFKPLTMIQFQPARAAPTSDYANKNVLNQNPAWYSLSGHDAD